MSAIGKGDWVECIDTRGCDHIVSRGGIYLVEEAGDYNDTPCLKLNGVVHPAGYRWVRAECFRPIYRPKSSFINSLKQPAPKRECEPC